MKPTLSIALGLLSLSYASAQEEQAPKGPRERVIEVDGPTIEQRLYSVTRWDLGGGVNFSVVEHDGKNEFLNEDGEVIHSIAHPLFVADAMASASGSCVIFRIQSYQDDGHLLRAKAKEGKVVFERFLENDSAAIPGREWGIMELGAVSDDGNTVVAQFFERVGGGGMYRWQTWRLHPQKRIGIGLTVEKTRKPGMRVPADGPAGEIAPEQFNRKLRPHPSFTNASTPELVDYLDGLKPWDHGGGLISRIQIFGRSVEITDGSGAIMFAYTSQSSIDPNMSVVASDSGSCLLFLLSYSGWTGSLVRVMPVDGTLEVDELWKQPFDLFSGKRWFIPDLGAVSDDGTRALMRIGRMGPDDRMIYGWQSWRLDPAEQVVPRMTVANGLTFSGAQPAPASGAKAR